MSQTRSEIEALLRRYAVTPRRGLGQHFLADRNLVNKMVDLAGDPARSRALEIGPGTGTITRALVEAGFAVTAYEIDERLRPILEESLGDLDVDLRFQDATRLDMKEFGAGTDWVLVSNLPYQVGTSILLELLQQAAGLGRCVVVSQREVAERLIAGPGSKAYGLPSVITALYGQARLEFRIPPQVFLPVPRVDSAAVSIQRVAPPEPLRGLAVRIAAAAFRKRRKMVRSSLRGVLPAPAEEILPRIGVDPTKRAEDLDPGAYLSIAAAILEAAH
ncbi:MAG: 16S rRNA (adenine(1518)-N(6)/adenine(1519)-N(6))-dimethyltransferase RsmA [bacterium]|nr:16S rRNA (adenine(1518)-N(6)/adenine(1519)-N(6))-dimethyltransferase RsmA [bacterium]